MGIWRIGHGDQDDAQATIARSYINSLRSCDAYMCW